MSDQETLRSTVNAQYDEIGTLHREIDDLRRDLSDLRIRRETLTETTIRQGETISRQQAEIADLTRRLRQPSPFTGFLPAIDNTTLNVIVEHLRQGNKIAAIKALREAVTVKDGPDGPPTTWSLGDSKRFVEHLHHLLVQSDGAAAAD